MRRGGTYRNHPRDLVFDLFALAALLIVLAVFVLY